MKTFVMAFLLAGLALTGTASEASAFERKSIVIKADTDYKQTVWNAIGLARTYSANLLPANPQAAQALAQLSYRNTYRCEAEYYLGSIGFFNGNSEKSVMMLYSLSRCSVQ